MSTAAGTQRLYDERAEKYEGMMWGSGDKKAVDYVFRNLGFHLPPQPRILDIGCGTGLATRTLKEVFPKSIIYGLDNSGEMLTRYHEEFPQATAIEQNFQRGIPLPDSSIDMAVSSASVSEYGNDKTLQDIHRILKNNSAFVNIGVKKNPITLVVTSLMWRYRPTTQEEFSRSCLEAGFSQVSPINLPWRTYPANRMRFAVMARK